MTALARPDVRLHRSWAETLAEMGPEIAHGSGLWHLPDEEISYDAAGCARVVETLLRYADDDADLPDGIVPCDYYWVTEDPETVIGFLAVRHRLNDWLFEEGGHIGYSIRPSRRRQGHASRALRLAVRRCGELGIERALVTCDEDNAASRRTIERNGGDYEDTRNGKRRYWLDTSLVPAGR